jgi:hypothetical protein
LLGEGGPELLSQEGFRLTLTGEFGAVYQIDGSTDLSGWTPLGTVTNDWGTVQLLPVQGEVGERCDRCTPSIILIPRLL